MLLVAEDDLFYLKYMRKLMAIYEIKYESFSDPVAALEAYKNDPKQYTGAVLDVHMPKLNGEDLADEIKKVNKEIPILFVTGLTDENNKKRLSEKGLYLSKDFTPKQFAESVVELMKSVNG